jgi:hypothetical protein
MEREGPFETDGCSSTQKVSRRVHISQVTVLLSREPSMASLCNIKKWTVCCGGICLGLYKSDTLSGLSATVNKIFGGFTQSLQANVWTVLPLGLKDLLSPFYSSSILPFQIIV